MKKIWNVILTWLRGNESKQSAMETITQKAMRLMKDIPEHQWISERYTDGHSKCCVLGHWSRLNSKNPQDYQVRNCWGMQEGDENDLRKASIQFFKKKGLHNEISSIASVNNKMIGWYIQSSHKGRSLACLQDMINAGF